MNTIIVCFLFISWKAMSYTIHEKNNNSQICKMMNRNPVLSLHEGTQQPEKLPRRESTDTLVLKFNRWNQHSHIVSVLMKNPFIELRLLSHGLPAIH